MENTILNEDCFKVFPKLSKECIDLIIVDLPFGQTALEWDCEIDLELMWTHLKRILKPNGQILFFCTARFGNKLINSNEKWFRTDFVYEKSRVVGHLSANRQPLRSHELIYLFHSPYLRKGHKWTYNPQFTFGEKPYTKNNVNTFTNVYNSQKKETSHVNDGRRFPRSIIKVSNDNHKSIHPTQKPIELLEWLIKSYSNENDLVLDFTAGSCSVAVACRNLKRRFICIEKNKEYYLKAIERFGLINNLNINKE